MGEYLSLLTQVKSCIYGGRIDSAKDILKKLLNSVNCDYNAAKLPAEREKIKKAILRLLPVLDELKAGRVGPNAITVLKLDLTRLPSQSSGSFSGASAIPPRPSAPVPPAVPPRPSAPAASSGPAAPAAPAQPAVPEVRPASKPPVSRPAAGGKNGAKHAINEMMPLTLDDYIGQEKAKRSLRISIGASKKTGRPLAHLLICSPYGLGKTTLTNIIANEMGMPFFNVNATNLKDVRSLSLYFSKIEESCIIFIDEIHTLKKEVQTVLLSIMTDFAVTFIDDSGEEMRYNLPPFTLIGATTQAGELLKPFLNRFSVLELEDYTEEEKLILVKTKLEKLRYEATEEAIQDIARRCRGIPRTIETFIKGVIDVATMRDEKLITEEITGLYFEIHEIDDLGLTKTDRKILRILDEETKPLALVTMESKSGIQKEDIAFRYEPYLIKLDFLAKTERGRIITPKGRKYLHPDEGGDLPGTDDSADGTPVEEPEIPSSEEGGDTVREDNLPETPLSVQTDNQDAAGGGSDEEVVVPDGFFDDEVKDDESGNGEVEVDESGNDEVEVDESGNDEVEVDESEDDGGIVSPDDKLHSEDSESFFDSLDDEEKE
ncbi:MAG: AAA family ATPase [Candidatus Coproplasma sp.]